MTVDGHCAHLDLMEISVRNSCNHYGGYGLGTEEIIVRDHERVH